MCGIFAALIPCQDRQVAAVKDEVPNERLRSLLTSRGPDHQAHHVIQVQMHSQSYFLIFYASVLHVRQKDGMQRQPVLSQETGDVLLFNGELFDLDSSSNQHKRDKDADHCHKYHLTPHRQPNEGNDDDDGNDGNSGSLQTQSDTRLLFDRLQAAAPENERLASDGTAGERATSTFVDVMSGLKGPFSIIFYRDRDKELWIGKDCLGRRSLCFALLDPDVTGAGLSGFLISSVCDPDAAEQRWSEVPANGFYRIRLPHLLSSSHDSSITPPLDAGWDITLFEWDRSPTTDRVHTHDLPFLLPHKRVTAAVRSPITCSLNTSAELGIGSNRQIAPENVMSQSQMGKSCSRLPHQPSDDHDDEVLESGKEAEGEDVTIGHLLVADHEASVVHGLERVLDLSVKRRIRMFHGLCNCCCRSRSLPSPQAQVRDQEQDPNHREESIGLSDSGNNRSESCDHASVAVLFSGGIDCTVIALIADRYVSKRQPIDLINVSFAAGSPDRLTSQAGLAELRRLCPNRHFQLVHVDVPKEELIQCREQVISRLIYPSSSVLDDSTGSAFFFASRGVGYLVDEETGEQTSYTSPARILLNGLGSDEQMAGYSRHRRIFHTQGVDAVNEEISREVDHLHRRNLGRDDRVVSHHGREVRFPFLDEDVVSFLNSVPIGMKCNLRLERGMGEKRLLRQVAVKLGLRETATREKRAIQFGSRIAKLEHRKEKGDMICSRLITPP